MKNNKILLHSIFLLFFLFAKKELFAQTLLKSSTMTVSPKAIVVMRDLPEPSKKNIEEINKKIPNDDEFEEISKPREIKTPQNKPSFVPTIVKTINGNENSSANRNTNIYESPCVSYQGIIQDNGTASSSNAVIPADVGGAVGFDHLFLTLNNRFRIQNKTGGILREEDQQNPTGFWASAGLDVSNLFDPKIIYDPYQNRWVHVIDAGGSNSTTSAIYVAVSTTADPMGGWVIYAIDTDVENDNWADYPSVGFNKNWVTINVNMLKNAGTSALSVSRTFIINKSELYAQAPLNITIYNASTSPYRYWTICPAKVYDPNYNDMWCATNDGANDNEIRFFKITGGPSNPVMTEEGFISIGTNWAGDAGNLGPQSGTTTKVNLGFDWVQSAVWRNGKLFFAQNLFTPDITNPTDATLQLVSCDPTTETMIEAIRFSTDANNMYANPNFVVNNNEDWIISCAKFTSSTFPSAATLVRRNGTSTFTESIFKSGEDIYISNPTRNRWGDYSTAAIDPTDDNSIWVAGDYSLPRVGGGSRWGTWWAKICSGVCNTNTFLNTFQPSGTMRKWEASNTVFANSVLQSGTSIKLDGGNQVILQPGFQATQGSSVRTYLEGCGGAQ
jgi:hypothetical protein